MKKILLLAAIVAAFAACTSKKSPKAENPTDLTKAQLKGDVKSVKTIKYTADRVNVINDLDNQTVEFNEKGMITMTQRLDSMGTVWSTTTNQYDPSGKLVEMKYQSRNDYFQNLKYSYTPQGEVSSEELMIKGSDDPLITKYSYKDGLLVQKEANTLTTIYHYDDKGLLLGIQEMVGQSIQSTVHLLYTESDEYLGREEVGIDPKHGDYATKHYNAQGQLTKIGREEGVEIYTYNTEGELISKITPTHNIAYTYKYDDKGNWIEKVQSSESTTTEPQDTTDPDTYNSITIRTIEYR